MWGVGGEKLGSRQGLGPETRGVEPPSVEMGSTWTQGVRVCLMYIHVTSSYKISGSGAQDRGLWPGVSCGGTRGETVSRRHLKSGAGRRWMTGGQTDGAAQTFHCISLGTSRLDPLF